MKRSIVLFVLLSAFVVGVWSMRLVEPHCQELNLMMYWTAFRKKLNWL